MSQLMTNWICVATEGDTVDRRVMDRQWLLDAAELYDPTLYAALIWPEHERWFGNMGEVLAVKAEEGDDGLVRLYVQLCPNHQLLQANKEGQLIFCSVELTEDGNFRGTGKCYLEGLGVTNEPASVGTTRLRFSQKRNHRYGSFRPLVIDEVKPFKGSDNHMKPENKQDKQSVFRSLFGIKSKTFSEGSEGAETTVDTDKLQALADALAELSDRVDAIEVTLTELTESQQEVADDLETVKEVVDTAEFADLRKKAGEMLSAFSSLKSSKTPVPNANPNGNTSKGFKFL